MSNIKKGILSLFALMFIAPSYAETKTKIIKTKVAKPTNKPCAFNNVTNPSEDSFGFKVAIGYETTRPVSGGTFTDISNSFAKLSSSNIVSANYKQSADTSEFKGHSIITMKDANMKYPGSAMINQISEDGTSNKLQLHKGGSIFGDISTGYEFSFGDISLDTEVSIGMKGTTTHNSVVDVETKPGDRSILIHFVEQEQDRYNMLYKYQNDTNQSEKAMFNREVKVKKSFRFGIGSELNYALFDSNQIAVRLDAKLEIIPKDNILVNFSQSKNDKTEPLANNIVLPVFTHLILSTKEPFQNTSSAYVGGIGLTTSASASLAGIKVSAFLSGRYDISLNHIKLSRKNPSSDINFTQTDVKQNEFIFRTIHDTNAEQHIKDLQIKGWVFGAGIQFKYTI